MLCAVEHFLSEHYLPGAGAASTAGGRPLDQAACQQLEDYILQHLAPQPRSGHQLFTQVCDDLRILQTGCERWESKRAPGCMQI
jgi:hypothetical protein